MTTAEIETKKSIIDFFKLLTGFAAGSILLVANSIGALKGTCIGVKILFLLSLLCFVGSVALGVFAILNVLKTFESDGNYRGYRISMLIVFSSGFFLLGLGIVLMLL